MKVSSLLGIGAVLLSYTDALAIHPRHQNVEGVIHAPMWRRGNTRSVENDLIRRGNLLNRRQTDPVTLYNSIDKLLYFANITIGTPAQKVALQIDTGSSDIWVEVPGSRLCQSRLNPCAATGTYNNQSSSSYRYLNSLFSIQYADGTQAVGDYATETFQIGSAKITAMQFGVGVDATSTEGVMGVGFRTNEAILQYPGTSAYPNLVDEMVSEGFIQSRTYSLYLDDIDTSTGEILFGGVDTDKFTGTLSTFPINTDSSGVATQFIITLTGLSVTPPSGSNVGIGSSSSYPLSVLLDSGSSYMSLPSNMVSAIAKEMGAQYSNQLGGYILPNCNQQYSDGKLNFFFSGVEIQIPYSEFIINPSATDGSPFMYNDGSLVCMIGVIPGSSNDVAVLGDTFLRSAYVVYDLDNQEISIAPTKFNTTSSNVQAIPSGKNKVPSATAVSNPTTLTLGSNIYASNLPNGIPPTGTGGAIGTGGSSPSAASGNGLWGSKKGVYFGFSTCICVLVGAWMAL